MPEIEDFLPIFPEETEESVLERLLVWLNDGVDSGDPSWIDPREGGMARTLLVPAAREMAMLYDRISIEFPAAAHPLFAWGEYLDQWAQVVGTQRLAATAAEGTVRWMAPNGTIIPAQTEVGADPGGGGEAPSYLTQSQVTVGAGGYVDVLAIASEAGAFGNVSAHAVTQILSTPPDPAATVDNADAMAGGTDEESDEELRERVLAIYSTSPGGGNVAEYTQWSRSVAGVGDVSVTPENPVPGGVLIIANAPDGNPVSDSVRTALRDYLDPVAVDIVASAASGTAITVGSTTGFRPSGIVHLGTMASERLHTYTGLTATQFTGVSPTPTFTAGDHAWQTGRGGGRAPVGHHVVVGKGTLLTVNITATIELDAGYSLTDADAISPRAQINAALAAYIDSLPPGGEVVLRRVEHVIMGIAGVHDITSTQINGVAQNLKPTATQAPVFSGSATLSQGEIT